MKSRLIFNLVFVLFLTSCEGIHDLIKLKVDKITYGDCKTNVTKSADTERIEFRTVDKNYLEIKHINAMFNCEPGRLLVSVSRENNTIFVDENEETAMADCVCQYDLCYKIGPLDYGHYNIEFQRGGLLYTRFSFYFNSKTSEVFEID